MIYGKHITNIYDPRREDAHVLHSYSGSSDSHLRNSIAMLKRRLSQMAETESSMVRQVMALPPPTGEHALDLYESGIDDLLENGYEDPRRESTEQWIDILEAEQINRASALAPEVGA